MNNGLKPIPKPIGMPTELPKMDTYCIVHTIYSLVLLMSWEFSVYIHVINCLLIESNFHKCHFSKASSRLIQDELYRSHNLNGGISILVHCVFSFET